MDSHFGSFLQQVTSRFEIICVLDIACPLQLAIDALTNQGMLLSWIRPRLGRRSLWVGNQQQGGSLYTRLLPEEGLDRSLCSDGVHYTAEGYSEFARRVFEACLPCESPRNHCVCVETIEGRALLQR